MSSSRNTSDSWVKKATGGLSPGSMAPLSSAVNMAASAYGVGFGSLSFSFFGSLLCFESALMFGMNNGHIFCPFRIFWILWGSITCETNKKESRESRAREELLLQSRRHHQRYLCGAARWFLPFFFRDASGSFPCCLAVSFFFVSRSPEEKAFLLKNFWNFYEKSKGWRFKIYS